MPDAPTIVSCSKLNRHIVSRIICKPPTYCKAVSIVYSLLLVLKHLPLLIIILLMAVHDFIFTPVNLVIMINSDLTLPSLTSVNITLRIWPFLTKGYPVDPAVFTGTPVGKSVLGELMSCFKIMDTELLKDLNTLRYFILR